MSIERKICMVTGANSGIGKATAIGIAKMGATVVMACRKKEESEAVRVEIQEKSGNDDIDLLIVDLSSQESVRNLANDFKKKYQKLHVLVNNAGVYFTKRHVTIDGLEMTFAVNYLSRFLLTNLLLDIIKQSAPARIIEVAGAYHAKGAINFDDLQMEQNYDGARANNQSKLANVLFTYELARRITGTGVTVNCLHPGAIATLEQLLQTFLQRIRICHWRPSLCTSCLSLFSNLRKKELQRLFTWLQPPKYEILLANTSSIKR